MSTFSGPAIINNGLVFSYDMNNIMKSFNGAPATNYVNTQAWGGDYAGNVFTQTVIDPSHQYRNLPTSKLVNTTSSFNCYINGGNLNQTLASTVWTFLCYIRRADRQPIPALATYLYSFSSDNASATVTSVGGGWYRVYRTKSGTSSAATLAGFTGLLQNVEYYVSGASLTPTAYPVDKLSVNTTRSSTEAILDLANRNTITAASVTYAPDGTFSFSTNNSIAVSPSSDWAFGRNGAIEAWVYPTSNTNTNNRLWCVTNVTTALDAYFNGATTAIYMHGGTVGTTTSVPLNAWTHVTVTYTAGVIAIYFNGVSQPLTGTTTGYNITNNGTLLIGNYQAGTGYNFNGKIPMMKIYNRTLTAPEVAQNFNAVRGRYGI